MIFNATKQSVLNRGKAPDDFLEEILNWAKNSEDEIFLPNPNPNDIYSLIKSKLATQSEDGSFHWDNLFHRKAAMLEAMRVHAGFESSWNWKAGVDVTNQRSMAHIESQETGIFQVSFDSLYLDKTDTLRICLYKYLDSNISAQNFIDTTKSNHSFALEYYGRLVRISIAWAGPLIRHEILPFLSKDSMNEFMNILSSSL